MSADDDISLRLTTARLRALCEHLVQDSARTEQALAGLVALQSLLATSAEPATQASAGYRRLKQLLDTYTEQTRQRLIQQGAVRLAAALTTRDSAAIAAIYAPLSRSGYAAAVEQALRLLSRSDGEQAAEWVHDWHRTAKMRGEVASGYPDAIDFAGAGIDVMEFTAMTDMLRIIGPA